MHARTTWFLLVLVLALGGVGWWLTRADEQLGDEFRRKLLPGYATAQVASFRIENLRRDQRVEIERRDRGWWIVDPVDYAAEPGVVNRLLDDLAVAPAVGVPDADPEKLGLDPPVAILEVYTRAGALEPAWRIEIGRTALNENVVYARTEGRVWRTLRNLETAVDRPLFAWRNARVVPDPVAFGSVAEIERQGFEPFRAVLDADGWMLVEPFRATLDPGRVTTFARGLLTTLRVERFLAEDPDGRNRYGLEDPAVAVRFTTATGQRTELTFQGSGRTWYCAHDDAPTVVEIDPFGAELFRAPVSELFDRRVLRLAHEEVQRVELVSPAGQVTLERAGTTFRVAGPTSNGGVLEPCAADGGAVVDLLGRLSQAEIEGASPELDFEADEELAVWVHGRSGGRFGGELGATTRIASGARGVLFRRPNDQVVGLVSSELKELIRQPADAFVSRVLHQVDEEQAASIELVRGDVRRLWRRDDYGRWSLEGSPDPDPEFELIVDRLRRVPAAELLDGATELADPIRVRIARHRGGAVEFEVGYLPTAGPAPAGDGTPCGYVGRDRAAVVDGDLVALLAPFVED